MLKILQIGLGSNPGGVENCIMNYYRHIDKSTFSFDFVDQYGSGLAYAEEIKQLGSTIYTLSNYKRYPFTAARQLQELLEQNHYDIVHVNMLSAANIIPIKISCSSKNNPVVIAHSHSTNTPSGMLRKIMNQINQRNLCMMPVEKWACSIAAGKWMWGDLFDTSNVIFNAIDTKRFHFDLLMRKKIRDICKFEKHEKVIGFVGRLCEEKNIFFILEILKELLDISLDYRLLVIGDGKLRDRFQEKLDRLKLHDYVYIQGMCLDTAPWYSAMDAFILPSHFEGLPVVGVEAQACSLPCFVSNAVPRELNITGNIKFLPIDKGAKIWADTINVTIKEPMVENFAFPVSFTISHAAKFLEKKYMKLV